VSVRQAENTAVLLALWVGDMSRRPLPPAPPWWLIFLGIGVVFAMIFMGML
jgi:hypothetical protein